MPERFFDALVLGGGAAGSAAALTLLQLGAESVGILEPSDFSEPRIGETIPPDTNELLYTLGVQPAFVSQNHLPCYGSHSLWGSRQLGHNDFLTSPFGHGWHLDRAGFDKMLLEQAVSRGTTRITAKATAIVTDAGRIAAVCAGGDSIIANWYLDATGRSAMLSRACGVKRHIDDKQVVIWMRFRVNDGSLGNATWLESAPYGWWYCAELPDGEAIVALGTDPRLAKSDGLYDMRNWAVTLAGTDLIAPRIARARMVADSFRVTASHSYLTRKVCGPNWIAVGDAASAFDPLSSAGVYKALSTGRRAARAIKSKEAMDDYQTHVENDFHNYLQAKAELYAAESRWVQHPFWHTRMPQPELAHGVSA